MFPGETTLKAASNLTAQGKFNLGLVILAGAVGAIAGDSALYWTARLSSKGFETRVEHIEPKGKVAAAPCGGGERDSGRIEARLQTRRIDDRDVDAAPQVSKRPLIVSAAS